VLPPAELEPVGEFSGHGTKAVAELDGKCAAPLQLDTWSSAEPPVSRSSGMVVDASSVVVVREEELGREDEVGLEDEVGREDDA
jgi:hypothetical protein